MKWAERKSDNMGFFCNEQSDQGLYRVSQKKCSFEEGNSLGWQIFGHSLTAENLGHLQGDIFWVIRCSFVSGRCLFCDSESFHGDSSIPGNFSPEIRKSLWDVGKGVVVSHVPVEHVELVHLHQVQVVPQHWLSDVVPADIEQINLDSLPTFATLMMF